MAADDGRDPRAGTSVVIGLFIMALGLVFLLRNFGVVDAGQVLRFRPAIFVLIGLQKALRPHPRGWRGEGSLWIMIGTWLLLTSLDLVEFGDLWALGLLLAGGHLFWRGLHPVRRVAGDDPTSDVSAVAIMGGFERVNASSDFRGGDLTAIMGGGKVDLTKARIVSGEAVVDVFVMYGGITLRVPEDWTVICRVLPIMGGITDKTTPPPADGQRLIVTGLALFGGIEIRNGAGAKR
jgi:predicted membrane protein